MTEKKVLAERNTKIIYRDGDKVIKTFNDQYTKAEVLNEALNASRVEESTNLNVPKILGVNTIDGKWSITSEYIEGKSLADLIKENPNKVDAYLDLLVDLQLKVQSCKVPLLTNLRDKFNRKIDECNLDPVVKYDLHTRIEGAPKHNKLCHGDFRPSNVIITSSGTPYILDWSHATQGNGSADAARTYLVLCLSHGEEFANKYLDLFVNKSGIAKATIQRWLPVVAASQTVNKKARKEELEFLMRWVNVVDYE